MRLNRLVCVSLTAQVLDTALLQLELALEVWNHNLVVRSRGLGIVAIILNVQSGDQTVLKHRVLQVLLVHFLVGQHLLVVLQLRPWELGNACSCDAGVLGRLLGQNQITPVSLVQEEMIITRGAVGIGHEDGNNVLGGVGVKFVDLVLSLKQSRHNVWRRSVHDSGGNHIEHQTGSYCGVSVTLWFSFSASLRI